MSSGRMRDRLGSGELERWLSEVFVPVQPSEVFIRRLRTRLLDYQGHKTFSVWTAIGMLAMFLIVLLSALGIALRIVLLLFSFIGLVDRRRRRKMTTMPAPSG